jgi:hypothetical protein
MEERKLSWRTTLAWLALYLPLAGWFLLAYRSLTFGVEWAAYLYPEDHLFENIGAVSLFLAAALSAIAFLRARRNGGATLHPFRSVLYAGMALVFLFVAGEEINWGQRIFHIPEPAALAPFSPQNELNLHGLSASESNPGPSVDNLFTAGLIVLAAGLPLAWLALPPLRRAAARILPAQLLGLAPLFLLNQGLAMYASDNFKRWYRYKIVRFPQAVQEIKESNFELLCLFLALIALWELGRRLRRSPIKTSPPQD